MVYGHKAEQSSGWLDCFPKMAEEEKSVEAVEEKDELQILRELVDDLYKFRDCYFETHKIDEAKNKQSDVAREVEQTLKKLEEKEESFKDKAEFWLQKGRCLNVAPDFSAVAEECLSRALKLEPSLVDAWNTLGEQHWKKDDLMGAKDCFTGALQKSKNKVSLRNMSMVLRQLPTADGNLHGKQVLQSVDMARQAVELDESDGTSWYILGNAYLSLFFTCGQDPQFSKQALRAYAQSESADKIAPCIPELHFNRAHLFQYEEMFGSALRGYSQAAALDPGWNDPPSKEKKLLEYLEKAIELTQNKGKVKTRRLRTMLSNLSTSALGPCSSSQFRSPSGRVGSLEPRPLSSFKHGHNAGVAALGKVVFSLASEDRMAFTFGMVDSEETCMVAMVYNTANSWGVLIGDSVVIPEPHLKVHSITHKEKSFDFKSIRVDSPLLLIVNGKKQNIQSQIATSVSYKPQRE